MIDRTHDLPITRQARALNISRGSVYYLPRRCRKPTLRSCGALTDCIWSSPSPGAGSEGCKTGRRHVRTLMKRMGIEALIAVRGRRSPSRGTRSIRICCAGWRSHGRTRCGRWTYMWLTIVHSSWTQCGRVFIGRYGSPVAARSPLIRAGRVRRQGSESHFDERPSRRAGHEAVSLFASWPAAPDD